MATRGEGLEHRRECLHLPEASCSCAQEWCRPVSSSPQRPPHCPGEENARCFAPNRPSRQSRGFLQESAFKQGSTSEQRFAPTRRRLHLTAFATRASGICPNMRRPHSKLKKVRDLGNHGLCSSPQPALALHSSVVALTTGRIRPGMRLGRSLPPLVNTMSYLLTRCSALLVPCTLPHCQPWPLRNEGGRARTRETWESAVRANH